MKRRRGYGYRAMDRIAQQADRNIRAREQEIENTMKTNNNISSDYTILLEDAWFTKYPSKILGNEQDSTNAFGKPIKVVKRIGDDHPLTKIEISPKTLPEQSENPLTSIFNDPIFKLLEDPEHQENITKVLKEKQIQKAEKAYQSALGKESQRDLNTLFTFKEIITKYNDKISEEELKAWVWYQYQKNGNTLPKSSGWNAYITPKDKINDSLKKWLSDGIVCIENNDYIPSVLYYAENVYQKQQRLQKTKKEFIESYGDKQFLKQWEGLENAKPPVLTLADPSREKRLFIKPTSSFAKKSGVTGLADGSLFTTTNKVTLKQVPAPKSIVDAFAYWLDKLPKTEFKKSSPFNIKRYYLEGKTPPRSYDKDEKLRIKQNAKLEGDQFFIAFLAEGLLREDQLKIEFLWNSKYNGYVEINYFKIPVGFSCSSTFKNKPLFIRPAQREGIGFISAHGSGCVAYDVGVGKTMTAILSIAQAFEAGKCKRPLIVVPNQTYKNWISELGGKQEKGKIILTGILPQYQINDLYNLSTDYLDELRDDQGNIKSVAPYSITVMTYEGFNRLAFKEDTWNEIGSELFKILNQGSEEEREKAKLWERIEGMMGKGIKGATAEIEDLGFDFLAIDEAHAMKKSFTQVKGEQKGATSKRGRSPYQIRSGQPSMTALRGFMISQYIQRQNNMQNVLLLTATPFTNSPLEIYSILSLICYQELEKLGIKNIKEFFDTFIKTSLQLVINAKMKPERREIVMGFSNLIALQSLIFKFISYKSGEDANIERPNKIVLPMTHKKVGNKTIVLPTEEQISTNIPMTPMQQMYMKDIEMYVRGRISLLNFCVNPRGFEDSTDDSEYEVEENSMSDDEKEGTRILRGLSFGRQLALSPYLYACNPEKEPTYLQYIESSPKLQYVMSCIKSVKEFHENRNELVSGQIIYMNAGVDYFPLIKDYLVKVIGYDTKEVGIIKSGLSMAKKEGIKERFLAGGVKIIIGSASIKEGINLQTRTTVLYNCWLDWNPTDIKQLEGRLWRFGNIFANVRIVNPLMENSIDSFIFQKLEEKTSRINEIWFKQGKTNALNLEEFNPSELKMGLITDPHALAELILLEIKENILDEITSLKNQKQQLENIVNARNDYDVNHDELKTTVDRYRPQRKIDKDGNPITVKPRAISTIFKIYMDYLSDEETDTSYHEQMLFDKVRKAHVIIQKGITEILEPRGYGIDFDSTMVIGALDEEIEQKEIELHEKAGIEAKENKANEIIQERINTGYKPKSVKERVQEFAKLNPKLLTDKMAYSVDERFKTKQAKKLQKGEILENNIDTLAYITKKVEAMKGLRKILEQANKLKEQFDKDTAA